MVRSIASESTADCQSSGNEQSFANGQGKCVEADKVGYISSQERFGRSASASNPHSTPSVYDGPVFSKDISCSDGGLALKAQIPDQCTDVSQRDCRSATCIGNRSSAKFGQDDSSLFLERAIANVYYRHAYRFERGATSFRFATRSHLKLTTAWKRGLAGLAKGRTSRGQDDEVGKLREAGESH
jgi:hypothetical protein